MNFSNEFFARLFVYCKLFIFSRKRSKIVALSRRLFLLLLFHDVIIALFIFVTSMTIFANVNKSFFKINVILSYNQRLERRVIITK